MLGRSPSGSTPKWVVACACGSRSRTQTRSPPRAWAAARLTAVVVFPTPPFWLITAIRRMALPRPRFPLDGRRTISAAVGVNRSDARNVSHLCLQLAGMSQFALASALPALMIRVPGFSPSVVRKDRAMFTRLCILTALVGLLVVPAASAEDAAGLKP